MKRSAIRWYALVLALMLIAVNMAYQLGGSFSAHEPEQQITKVEQQAGDAAATKALEDAIGVDNAKALADADKDSDTTDDGEVTVQEIDK